MFEHGAGVVDEVGDVLLHGSGNQSDDGTYLFSEVPLWKFQVQVESTAVVQPVTLLVHQAGLCLLLMSYNSKNIPDRSRYNYINSTYSINFLSTPSEGQEEAPVVDSPLFIK